MDRKEALKKLQKLKGKDIYNLAEKYDVTVCNKKTGKQNKGWFGHVIEHFLGLPINSSQSPNFGSWELKTTSLKYLKNGNLVPKETLAITMIDRFEVKLKKFEDSHLYSKLKKLILVARIVDEKYQNKGLVYDVVSFDLSNKKLLNEIKKDFNLIKKIIRKEGFDSLSGKFGKYIQPRTKGAGHGSTSRAFYARKNLVKIILNLEG
ncbi:MAG: MvaI/BcnI family restriction endonuclease [Alphaproteobacteria bacterium]|nr:MAG: hypothetical protein B6I23_01025 [Rickettsiaceae bacterium 4572_127]